MGSFVLVLILLLVLLLLLLDLRRKPVHPNTGALTSHVRHPERRRAPARFLQRGIPESKDLLFCCWFCCCTCSTLTVIRPSSRNSNAYLSSHSPMMSRHFGFSFTSNASFLSSTPSFQLPLAVESSLGVSVLFVIDQSPCLIFRAETVGILARAVLNDARDEEVGHADIERPPGDALQHINKVAAVEHSAADSTA